MDTAVFTPDELSTALGAMCALSPEPNVAQDRFVRTVGTLHGVAVDLSVLPIPTPAQTAAVITDPERRRRLLRLALVNMLLASARPATLERAAVELAEALGTHDAVLQRSWVPAGREADA